MLIFPIFCTSTVVIGPADKPPSGFLLSQIMRRIRLRALFCPPIILEQLVQEPDALEKVRHLDFITYAGGPLSDITGNLLSQETDVCQFYGSTEMNVIPLLVPRREDWAAMEFHPAYGVDMQLADDDAFECVLHKDPASGITRSFEYTFPGVEEWRTEDLFRPVPGKPKLWLFHGRRDDIIVLSSGEKFNPVPSERLIGGHPQVSGALIVGQGRFQAALLLELQDDAGKDKDTFIENIWPLVEKANTQAPGHGRIFRSMIAVADPKKRFERAGKGTVIRKMTARKFTREIDALYSKDRTGRFGPRLSAPRDIRAINNYVRESVALAFPVHDLHGTDNLYVLGLDSLRTVEIGKTIKHGLGDLDTSWPSPQTLYANPTIDGLADAIFARLNGAADIANDKAERADARTKMMASLVQKYTQDLPPVGSKIALDAQRAHSPHLNVVLTGSTGSLGTQLLRVLLEDDKVAKIYCLNRTQDAPDRQSKTFTRLGFSHSLVTPRIQFITVEYGQKRLGLPEEQYKDVISSVDVIIHNAWKVDFNHSLESFEPVHIRGVRNFIDWSTSSSRNPHIIFVSSISSIRNRQNLHSQDEVLEVPILDHGSAQTMGYGESKNVAECILDTANKRAGVPVSILRVGQIAGPVTTRGVWNRDEWFPSMIKTSKSLGLLPNSLPDIDWIPVDTLAAIIRDIAHFAVDTGNSRVYNVVNPRLTEWASLVSPVTHRLGQDMKLVDLRDWIESLAKVNLTDTDEITAKPAVKILGFFRNVERNKITHCPRYSTAHGVTASKTMTELQPVSEEWMQIWLDQWAL